LIEDNKSQVDIFVALLPADYKNYLVTMSTAEGTRPRFSSVFS